MSQLMFENIDGKYVAKGLRFFSIEVVKDIIVPFKWSLFISFELGGRTVDACLRIFDSLNDALHYDLKIEDFEQMMLVLKAYIAWIREERKRENNEQG